MHYRNLILSIFALGGAQAHASLPTKKTAAITMAAYAGAHIVTNLLSSWIATENRIISWRKNSESILADGTFSPENSDVSKKFGYAWESLRTVGLASSCATAGITYKALTLRNGSLAGTLSTVIALTVAPIIAVTLCYNAVGAVRDWRAKQRRLGNNGTINMAPDTNTPSSTLGRPWTLLVWAASKIPL